jgi:translocation and assembly module TamB
MAEVKPDTDLPDLGPQSTSRWRFWPERWRWRVSIVLGVLLALVAGLAWFNRVEIAGSFIDDTLVQYELEASYEIEDIDTQRQVITNLVIGDPQLPDLTADRVTLLVSYTYGPPAIGKLVVENPRLFGSFKEGQLSFGSLDKLLFAESEEPAGLPSLNLTVVDGRARIESDYGVIGAKVEGEGQLDDGFAGKLAATAPGLGIEGCSAQEATLYGDVTSADGRLSFDGPLRFREAECQGNRARSADIGVLMTLAQDLGSIEGDLAIGAIGLSSGEIALAKLGGSADVAWAFDGELSLRHQLEGTRLTTPYGAVAALGADGTLRSRENFARSEWTSRVTGGDIDLGTALSSEALTQAREAASGTFAGELLGKLEAGFSGAAKGSAFAGDISVRTDEGSVRAVVPEARLRAASGETLLALSRLSYNTSSEGQPERLTGNILTGGVGLPRINARLQPAGEGEISMRMTMAEYREGENAFSVPRLEARRDASGVIRFSGIARAEGILPGGNLQGLEFPMEGRYSSGSGLAFGTRCLDARIEGLETNGVVLAPQNLSVCPDDGKPLLAYRGSLEVAAQLSDFSLAGSQGGSPLSVSAAKAVLRYPGASRIEALSAKIGTGDNAVQFAADTLEGDFENGLSGRFNGAEAALSIVPLDLTDLSGQWSFADNVLTVSDGAFTLSDRMPADAIEARFEPLQAKDAVLTLADGLIRAETALVNPWSGRRVTNVMISHDLEAGEGRADITVPGIRFDEGFQPEELTPLTKGLIAFVDGEIAGEGLVEWNGDDVTSSGSFSTESFDFAAAFGPVRGVRGTIEFTDLLSFTTAPAQLATIASVNPGVEALGGRVVYSIENGTLITVEDGRWPFMGGELILRPVELDYGGGKGQNYIFEMVGLDAATFVTQMELANISATGKFDGTIPIIFDAQGNGTIQGGLMISRPPGGNVSYVGELTYEDLGAMGNFAFQTLRSLDYNQMSIELNGNLAGEIITNFNIDGVRQGEGASQNFVTRELAKLPIRFKVNVRSENFYTLATIVRGIFDPTVFASAAEVERFVGENIGALQSGQANESDESPAPTPEPVTTSDDLQRRGEPAVQPPESEDLP